ncbi:MAG: SpoIIE family protein phosphatase [Bacteroidetes bacterium]|jgi:sigma-B regulation protein RsbU (phosphoserine phosphatase)|nr:SpoIIE family protein phosphatase [Bacteroidota bacterium]
MPDSSSTQVQRTERFDLRALYETSRLLSASLDLEFVLNNLLLTAMSKLLVTRGMALLFDPLEDAYRVASLKGMPTVEKDERLHLDAIPADELLRDDEVPEVLAEHRVKLVLPVAFGHRRIGLIGLGAKATGQPFEERELEFIQSLVNMSSAAVHNSLMVEELKQANRDLDNKIQQLNTLFDLSQEFNATLERDRLVKLLSFALMGQMLVGKHVLLLRQQDAEGEGAGGYEMAAKKGVKGEMGEATIARLFEREELVLLQDDADDADAWAGLHHCGLVLALPLRQQSETHAVLCLGPKMTGQDYTPEDVEFLYALGNLAFVSIQNLELVEEQIEKERLEKEMRLAREIQEGLLPQSIPTLETVEVGTLALPSRYVGGDYFDVVKLDDHRLLIGIADVTGKGVPAALLMASLQACLQTMVPMDLRLEEAVGHMNRVICTNTGFDKFITAFFGIYDAEDQHLEYVNAGHDPPMLARADGRVERLEAGGLLLGVMASAGYERGRIDLHPGDVALLYTDGVTEAMSPDDEEYTPERLEERLLAVHDRTAQQIIDAVQEDICRHTGDIVELSDDRTMVALKVKG